MISDLRFIFRSLLKNRGFTIITVATLALGIGSATAIFSVTDWILFKTNPHPKDVVLIGGQSGQQPVTQLRFDYMLRAYQEQTSCFDEFAYASPQTGNVVINDSPVDTNWMGVSERFLALMNASPIYGRGFRKEECKEGANNVVIVSEHFAKRHFGNVNQTLGKEVAVGGTLCTIIGILGENQALPLYTAKDIFRPHARKPNLDQPWESPLFLFARIRAGTSRVLAAQQLQAAKPDTPTSMRMFWSEDHPVIIELSDLNQVYRPEVYRMLVAAVLLLYGIACLNASNLILMRMLRQRREISIRLALGSGRWRTLRLLLLESLSLGFIASLAGLLVANWMFPIFLQSSGGINNFNTWSQWTLSWRAMGVLGALSLITCGLIVIIPAVRFLRKDISSGLRETSSGGGESPMASRIRTILIIIQSALAVTLLAGACLMVRSFQHFEKLDLGFDPNQKLKLMLTFPAGHYSGGEKRLARLYELQEEIKKIPGVCSAGFGNDILLPGYYTPSMTIEVPGGAPIKTALYCIGKDLPESAGVHLIKGRFLDRTSSNEVVVNEAFAKLLWPNQDPVGKFIRPINEGTPMPSQWKGWEVAGLIKNLSPSPRQQAQPCIYAPETWAPETYTHFIISLAQVSPESIAPVLRKNLYALDPQLTVLQIQSLTSARDSQLWAERMASSVLKSLALIALFLTSIGMFSSLSYAVDLRMNEFGIRLALGADRSSIVMLVLRKGIYTSATGISIGLLGAFLLSRALDKLLFETSITDPTIAVSSIAILLAGSALACAVPAWRASRSEICSLLRSE